MSENAQEQDKLPKGLIDRKGASAGKTSRLPSLRGPRDLTLGGVPKKVFTPTIPARRDKIKEEPTLQKQGKSSNSNRGKHERGSRGRGRGRGRENTLVQSHSIFEQGPAQTKLPSRGGGGASYRDEGGGSSSKMSIKREKNSSNQKDLDMLLRDDFIDDGDVKNDMPPVMLPLASFIKQEIKSEGRTDIKLDIDDDDSKHSNDVEMVSDDKIKTSDSPRKSIKKDDITTNLSCKNIFTKCTKSEEGDLLFFQLPDTLPGLPPSRDKDSEKPNKTKTSTDSTENEEQNITNQFSTCSLSEFSEGQIGKLQIRKSGKVELLLGNVKLDVSAGSPSGFLQEIVSVDTAYGTGSMCVLGHIKQKLICTPNFESLLNS